MKATDVDRITNWIVRRGLEGAQESDLLREFCEKCNEAGLPVTRALVLIDTLHPVHEGTVFRWRNDDIEENATLTYGRTTEGAIASSWHSSPFYHLLQVGDEEHFHGVNGPAPGWALKGRAGKETSGRRHPTDVAANSRTRGDKTNSMK